jgi:hypothetical protein
MTGGQRRGKSARRGRAPAGNGQYARLDRDPGELEKKAGDQLPDSYG